MDFAKSLLEKYGWKEGQGIGKNSDGIVKPVKANLKFDNAGLGHDKAKEFTDQWWQKAFNDAANNIKVNSNPDNVSLSVENKDSVEITTSGFSAKHIQKIAKNYDGTFTKSQLALSEDVVSKIEEISGCSSKMLTDDELLKACGGRTAHKGARHGLKLNGKLSRIEAQDQLMLANMSNNNFNSEAQNESRDGWIFVKKHKKHKRNKAHEEGNAMPSTSSELKSKVLLNLTQSLTDSEKVAALLSQDDYTIKYNSKKKKKEHRRRDKDLAEKLSNLTTESSATTSESMRITIKSGEIKPSGRIFIAKDRLHQLEESSKKIKKDHNRSHVTKEKKHSRSAFDSVPSTSYNNTAEHSNKNPEKCKKKHVNKKLDHQQKTTEQIIRQRLENLSTRIEKFRKRAAEDDIEESDDFSSDEEEDDDGDKKKDSDKWIDKIKDLAKENPSGETIVLKSSKLTPFMSKRLRKAGIDVKVEHSKQSKKQTTKEQIRMNEITNKLAGSMSLSDDSESNQPTTSKCKKSK